MNEPAQTRAGLNEAALRASAGIANANNPYSLANMQKAMNYLAVWLGGRPKPLYATHEYVRFLPKDSVELTTLEDKLKLVLFDYPLDRVLSDAEIEFYSNDFINGFCWKYTLVPKRYVYPDGIRREVLQDAYLQNGETAPRSSTKPEDNIQTEPDALYLAGEESELVADDELLAEPDAIGSVISPLLSEGEYDQVVEQSMKSVGLIVSGGPSSTAGRAWTPSAEITYYDDALQQTIPLQTIEIRVNTLFNVGTGFTDADGRVTIAKGSGGKFRNPVQYQLKFRTDRWKINNPNNDVATIRGPKESCGWNYTINQYNKEYSAYAAVHRALHYFYYKQGDITKPFYTATRLVVKVFWNESTPDKSGQYIGGQASLPWLTAIKIWGKNHDTGAYYNRHFITSVTFHELGHASHDVSVGNFIVVNSKVKESYARAVEYYFTTKLYPDPVLMDQMMQIYDETKPNYTLIGLALFNQGITMSQLESAVNCATTWDQWKQAVKNKSAIPTWLVDFLFANATKPWNFNFEREAIRINDDENLIHAYVGQPVRFVIQSDLTDFGFRAQSWSLDHNDAARITESTGGRCVMTFNKTGTYTVSSKIFYQNSTSFFIAEKEVIVRDLPAIQGNRNPRLGVPETYQLDEFTHFNGWEFGYYIFGQFVDASASIKRFEPSVNPNGFSAIMFKPGNYVIRAAIGFDSGIQYVDFPINIKTEGGPPPQGSQELGTGIYPVYGYQHKTSGNKLFKIFDKESNPVNVIYQSMGNAYSFRAFNEKPSSDHPLYKDMVEIYEHQGYYGGFAYTNSQLIRRTDGKLPMLGCNYHEPIFVASKIPKPGMIPIFEVDVTNRSGYDIVSAYRYPSIINVSGKVETSGSITTTTTNMGVMGYVYPY